MTIFTDVAGYAFAISYQNDPSKVTLENLVIFTTNKEYAFIFIFRSFTHSYGPAPPTEE